MGVKCFLVEMLDANVWREVATGKIYFSNDEVPPGGMWYADWIITDTGLFRGPDGHCLVVKLPNKCIWIIDSICSNCTDRAGALRGEHQCWVRHGTPPLITVDKNGKTCGAGAGSIYMGDYHGFLREGEFVDA